LVLVFGCKPAIVSFTLKSASLTSKPNTKYYILGYAARPLYQELRNVSQPQKLFSGVERSDLKRD
jgi:hypothetical protein